MGSFRIFITNRREAYEVKQWHEVLQDSFDQDAGQKAQESELPQSQAKGSELHDVMM